MSVKVNSIPLNQSWTTSIKNDLVLGLCFAETDQNQNLNDFSILNKHRSDKRNISGNYMTYSHSADSSDMILTGYNSEYFIWDAMLIDGSTGNNIKRFVSNDGSSISLEMYSNNGLLFVREANSYLLTMVPYWYNSAYTISSNGYIPALTKLKNSNMFSLAHVGNKFWGFLIS